MQALEQVTGFPIRNFLWWAWSQPTVETTWSRDSKMARNPQCINTSSGQTVMGTLLATATHAQKQSREYRNWSSPNTASGIIRSIFFARVQHPMITKILKFFSSNIRSFSFWVEMLSKFKKKVFFTCKNINWFLIQPVKILLYMCGLHLYPIQFSWDSIL